MALKCDACGYDNRDDALLCNLCGKIFRKERKAPPARPERPEAPHPPPAISQKSPSVDASGAGAGEWNTRGVTLFQQGRFRESLECFEKSLFLDPRAAAPWVNKANALFKLGQAGEALRCHAMALSLEPLQMECWFSKAMIEKLTGQGSRSLRSLEEFLGLAEAGPPNIVAEAGRAAESLRASGVEPADREALGWLAEGTRRGVEGQFARALACMEKSLALDASLPLAWHNKAGALAKLGRHEEAIVCQDKAIELDQGNPRFWHWKGVTLRHLRRFEEALSCYDRALAIDSGQPGFWSDRGLALGILGRHDEALDSYQKAIALAPDAAPPWLNKAMSEEEMGRYADAVESYEKFLALASPEMVAQVQHASLRLEGLKPKLGGGAPQPSPAGAGSAREVPEAPSMFAAAEVTGAPERSGAEPPGGGAAVAGVDELLSRGRALEEEGKHAEAIDFLDPCLAQDPQNGLAWYIRGNAIWKLGEREEALASYDRSLEAGADPRCWNSRGLLLQEMGRLTEAVESFVQATRLAPDFAKAFFNHGNLLEKLSRREEALRCYDDALQADPMHLGAWNNKGLVLRKLGRLAESLACFEKIVAIQPTHAVAWYNKGVSELGSGRSPEGAQSLQKFLSLASPERHKALIEDARRRLQAPVARTGSG